jgi:hypothetical protein
MEHERGAFKVIREMTAIAFGVEPVCTLSGHIARGTSQEYLLQN